MKIMVSPLGRLEEVESPLEGAEADELVALEVPLAEAVLDHLAVELLHAAGQVVLEAEVGQVAGELVEVDPVVPRVGADLAGVDDPGGRDQPLDLVADVAHLVVLAVAADVDGLVVDGLPGGAGEGGEGAGDVAAVDQGPPGRAVGLDPDLAVGHGRGQQVVDDQVDPEHRRVAVGGGVAEIGRA